MKLKIHSIIDRFEENKLRNISTEPGLLTREPTSYHVRHCGLVVLAPACDGTVWVRFPGSVGYISHVLWAYDYLGPIGVLWVHMAWHKNVLKNPSVQRSRGGTRNWKVRWCGSWWCGWVVSVWWSTLDGPQFLNYWGTWFPTHAFETFLYIRPSPLLHMTLIWLPLFLTAPANSPANKFRNRNCQIAFLWGQIVHCDSPYLVVRVLRAGWSVCAAPYAGRWAVL